MHARHDEERAERAHQERNHPSRILIQPVEAYRDDLAHQIAQRSCDDDGDNACHNDGNHRRQENLDRFGGIFIGNLFNVGLHPYDQQNRARQNCRNIRAAVETLCRGYSQNERQEIKQRITEGVENLIGLGCGIHQLQGHQKRQQRFDHT